MITAVINSYLRPHYLERCTESIRVNYPDVKIQIVSYDNLSKARNEALKSVKTPFTLIGDDDFLYSKESNLDSLVKLLDNADIAGGKVESLTYEGTISFVGNRVHLSPLTYDYSTYEGVRFQRCDFVSNFFVAKTDTLRRIEWDETMRIEYEHLDFFLEAERKGARVVFCPDASVGHHTPELDALTEAAYTERRRDGASSKKAFFDKWEFYEVSDMSDVIIQP